MMTEQFSTDPEQHIEHEPTIREILDAALADGYIELGDVVYFGTDREDTLLGVASYIEAAGGDFEEFMSKWGIIVEFRPEGDADEV